jgi:hypothetical protein
VTKYGDTFLEKPGAGFAFGDMPSSMEKYRDEV